MSLNLALVIPPKMFQERSQKPFSVALYQTPTEVTRRALKGDPKVEYERFLRESEGLNPKTIADHMEMVSGFLEEGYSWSMR